MPRIFDAGLLDRLIETLRDDGYVVVGPTLRDGAIIYDRISSIRDLPAGWTDEQAPGLYRLKKREDSAFFGYAAGPHSWKRFLFPPLLKLWSAERGSQGELLPLPEEEKEPIRYAFLGVRACDLAAIKVQDRVFMGGTYTDPYYRVHRERIFIVALNCSQAGGNCFCVSMGTGPKAETGFDLAITESVVGDRHEFLVDEGSDAGLGMLSRLNAPAAKTADIERAEAVIERTRNSMGRTLKTEGIKELLYRNLDHPRWDDVADRCMACTNCTMVCPTCFCSSVEDSSDLTGTHAERTRKWDSCYTMDFTYIHGGSIRRSIKSRYRQWLTHKLATWIDQFGTSGCVGCGRCITWCPVGIDITEEVRAIEVSDGKEGNEDAK